MATSMSIGITKDRKHLKHITDYFNLAQIIEQPTRITHCTQSRIDLVFTNKPERITNIHNLLTGLSDHNAIFFSRKVKCSKNPYHTSTNRSIIMIIHKNQLENVDRALKDVDWSGFMGCDDADVGSDLFLSKVKEVILSFSRRGRQGKKKSTSLPWLNSACLKLMKHGDQLLRKSIKSGLNTDRLNFTVARNKVTSGLRKAKADFFIQIIENARGNSKKIW